METIRDNEEEKKSCEGINIVFIGHPIRKKQEFIIDNEKYRISFDKFKKDEKSNEDPFIWNKNFLYSFCHANHALSTEIRQLINKKNEEKEGEKKDEEKKEEVYFVFVAKTAKDSDIFEIDTIIKAEKIYEWPPKNKRFEENLCNQIFNEKVIKYHLPYLPGDGTISEHDNVNLYTCVGNEDGSFLPMVKGENEDEGIFIPYKFENDDSKKLLELIQVKNSKRYYVVQKNSPRLSINDLKDDFKSISKIVIDLIKEEQGNKNKLIDGKRFLKAKQIHNLDKYYRSQDRSESVNKK